jgi:anti-sigma regulatory factor (Ser/Thr protein kinase)
MINQLDSDLDMEARESVGLALRELLVHALESGGHRDSTQQVRVLRRRAPGVLVYRITNPGPGLRFGDLRHAALAHANGAAIAQIHVRDREGNRVGGLGLMRVKANADELVYNERGNEVTFVKYLVEPSGGSLRSSLPRSFNRALGRERRRDPRHDGTCGAEQPANLAFGAVQGVLHVDDHSAATRVLHPESNRGANSATPIPVVQHVVSHPGAMRPPSRNGERRCHYSGRFVEHSVGYIRQG